MSAKELPPPSAYAALVRAFADDPRVSAPEPRRGAFGTNGLKVDGKIFAMLVRGALVVKLPKAEVDAAVADGRGERLSMGEGRVTKEWLVVHTPPSTWLALASRARAFVGAPARRGAGRAEERGTPLSAGRPSRSRRG